MSETMIQPITEQDGFRSAIEELYSRIGAENPLQKLRKKSWDLFKELGLPTRQSEVFQYIPLRGLYNKRLAYSAPFSLTSGDLTPFLLPECRGSVLVFVNGHFDPQLSCFDNLPKKLVVSLLHDAMKTYNAFLQNQWTKVLREEKDPFAALNGALHQDGAFIYLPPKTIVEVPVQVLLLTNAGERQMLMTPRLQMFIGMQSQIDLHVTHGVLSSGSGMVDLYTDIAMDEGAQVRYTTVSMDVPKDLWQCEALRASLKRDAVLHSVAATIGSQNIRHDYKVSLAGENCEAHLNGICMLAENRESHSHVMIDHQAPNCRSTQLFKGVLTDASRSSFEGKIVVRQAAQKTDAFQLNNNLLISDRAHADSKPNLEIFADDVKASHGATMGQLDAEQVFYMKTRGFNERTAKSLLVQGFCREVIDKISLASLHQSTCEKARRSF